MAAFSPRVGAPAPRRVVAPPPRSVSPGGGNYGYNTGGRMRVVPTPPRPRVMAPPPRSVSPGGGNYGYDTGGKMVVTTGAGRPIHFDPMPPGSVYSGPGKIQLTAGYTPDYNALMRADPGYLAAQNTAKGLEASGAAQRRENIRQQYIAYGGDLAGFTDKYGDIDQTTRDLASQNQYSTLASMNRQQGIDQRTQAQQLAARGALESGDLAYGLDQLNTAYGQNRYNAGQAFGQQYNQDVNDYTGVLSTNAQNLAAAIQSAYSNSITRYQPREATYADYDADSSAKYKKPIFKGAGGTLYTQDGQVFTA